MPENQINSVVQTEIERNLLGGEPKYNRADIVEKSGIPLERVIALWIGMGFPVHTDTDALVYTDADLTNSYIIKTRVDNLLERGIPGDPIQDYLPESP